MALEIHESFTKSVKFFQRNHVVNLEPHSMPVFLFGKILTRIRTELRFKGKIETAANMFLHQIKSVATKKIVFVGIHARRGDRLINWKNGKEGLCDILMKMCSFAICVI